jgi:hypothetical protein
MNLGINKGFRRFYWLDGILHIKNTISDLMPTKIPSHTTGCQWMLLDKCGQKKRPKALI